MTKDKNCNCPETDDEYGNFPEPAREYCRAKKKANQNLKDRKLDYLLKQKKSELFHTILKNGTLYPCPEDIDREDYNSLKNEAIAEALIIVCEKYDPTKANLSTWINKKLRFEFKIKKLRELCKKPLFFL